ncbi:helix-turn-helix domain-containing protein [Desulfatiferula olefinivorans]
MIPINIDEIIKAGENSRVEFKSVRFHSDFLAKEVVAFANMNGGDIYVGISDQGMIEHVDKGVEERIVNICRNTIQPSIIPEITSYVVEGKKILRVTVEKGMHKPYKVKTSNRFYIRAGSVSIEPSNEELIRLFQDGQHLHFEVSPVVDYTTKDFDLLRFRDYVERHRGLSFEENELEQFLYNLQCVDEQNRISVVGLLFFGSNPSRYLPQSGIEMNAFDGVDTASDLLDYQSNECTLVDCISLGVSFVQKHSATRVMFDPDTGNRIEKKEFETFAIREIIVNAFMHRDWSVFGQRIRINLFKDRVEIFSPGGLPNTLNLTRALSGISYYRNPIVSQMLKDYKLADRVGRGLQAVVNHYKTNGLKAPRFEDEADYFRVTLYRAE